LFCLSVRFFGYASYIRKIERIGAKNPTEDRLRQKAAEPPQTQQLRLIKQQTKQQSLNKQRGRASTRSREAQQTFEKQYHSPVNSSPAKKEKKGSMSTFASQILAFFAHIRARIAQAERDREKEREREREREREEHQDECAK
jgi:hypothetical protein